MLNLLRLLRNSLILWVVILQFLLSPILDTRSMGFFFIDSAYAQKDQAMEDAALTCLPPKKWTGSKCVNPQEVVETRREAKESVNACKDKVGADLKDCQDKMPYIQGICDGESKDADGNPDAKKMNDCFNRNKDKSLAELKEESGWNFDGEVMSGLAVIGTSVAAINLSMAVMALVGMQSGSGCASRTYFSVVAAANVLAEIYFYFFVESKLRDIKDEYEAAVDKNGYGGQRGAYEYVIKEQDAVASIHNTKFTVYLILGIAYAIGIIIAILEIAGTFGVGGACTPGHNKSPPVKTEMPPSLRENVPQYNFKFAEKFANQEAKKDLNAWDHIKNILFLAKKLVLKNTFEESYAGTDDQQYKRESDKTFTKSTPFIKLLMGGGLLAAGTITMAVSSSVRNYLMTSAGVLITCTISATLSGLMAGFSKAAAVEAEEHKALVEQLLKVFDGSVTEQCDTRDDLSKPKCYCYTEEGSKNPSRSKSETCQKLWASDGVVKPPKAQDKALAGSKESVGCVTISGQFDEECRCKQVTQANGKNLCKSGFLPTQLNNIGNATGMNDVVKKINDMNSGGFGKGKYDGSGVAKNAAKIKRIAKDLKTKNAKLLMSKGYDPSKDLELTKSLVNQITKDDLAKYGPSNQLGALADSAPAGVDANALKEAREKAGISSASYSGGSLNAKKENANQPPAFSFGGDAGGGGGKDLGFMEKKYDYKDNDIVKNESASIWQVITNRYNVSGLKRLFDDGAPVPAEGPAPQTAPKTESKP